MSEFIYRMQILEHHLDSFGHVNNAKYLEIFEACRWEMIDQGGFGLEQIKESQKGPIVLEVNVKFKNELFLREWITIDFIVESTKDKKVLKAHQTIYKDDGTVAAIAEFKFGFFDLKKRKLIAPTKAWLKALDP